MLHWTVLIVNLVDKKYFLESIISCVLNGRFNMENSNNQKFCLKWNNFHNNFMSQFEALKEDEDFVDVTLYSYGQCVKAHKVVLSACSPYLKNIFKEHPSKHPIIILDNLSFNNLEAVIQFVYTGQVYIEQDELSSFLKAAETLQIRGLFESSKSENLVQTNLSSAHETNELVSNSKREDDDSETKKLKSKKLLKKVCNSATVTKENDDLHEEQKSIEKDCCANNNNNNNKSEESNENINLNDISEEHTLESVDKICDEDYTPELKRPHWLDPRSCPLCNRVYSNLSNLRQHMKLIHNPTLVTCKLCYKTFKTDLYLRRHLIGFHELNSSSNGSMLSLESYKPMQSQIPEWNPDIKLEPDAFHEMFNANEMYQIPQ